MILHIDVYLYFIGELFILSGHIPVIDAAQTLKRTARARDQAGECPSHKASVQDGIKTAGTLAITRSPEPLLTDRPPERRQITQPTHTAL